MVISTKGRVPFELIYYEACVNEQDARIREKYLKSGRGKRYLKNRLKRFLFLTGSVRLTLPLLKNILSQIRRRPGVVVLPHAAHLHKEV